MRLSVLLADEVKGFVDGDAVEPSGERGLPAKRGKMVPHLDESVLQHVAGIVMVKHDMPYLVIKRLTVGAHQ